MKRTSRPATRKAAGRSAGTSRQNMEEPPSPPPIVFGTRSSSPEVIGFKIDRATGELMVKQRAWVAIDPKFMESGKDPRTVVAEIEARRLAGEKMVFRDSEDKDAKLITPIKGCRMFKDISDDSDEEDETPSAAKKRKESKVGESKSH